MGERKYLQIMTYKHWDKDGEFSTKTSFKTPENAIKDAKRWIETIAKRWHRDVLRVEIYNKETKELMWRWEA